MNHDLQIVVADSKDGKLKLLYLGSDTTKANEVFEKDSENETVRLFPYPQALRTRHPLQEAADIKARTQRSSEADRKREEALNQARLDLRKLDEQAQLIRAEHNLPHPAEAELAIAKARIAEMEKAAKAPKGDKPKKGKGQKTPPEAPKGEAETEAGEGEEIE